MQYCRFSDDGRKFISSLDGSIAVSHTDGEMISAMSTGFDTYACFLLGDVAVAVGKHSVKCWFKSTQNAQLPQASNGSSPRHKLPHQVQLIDGGLIPLHNSRVVCLCKSAVFVWCANARTQLDTVIESTHSSVSAGATSPDGNLLAVALQSELRIWCTRQSHKIREVACIKCRHRENILCVTFSPDCCLLATGSNDCTVRIYHLHSLCEVATLAQATTSEQPVHAVAFSPNSRRVLAVRSVPFGHCTSRVGQMELWERDTVWPERVAWSFDKEETANLRCKHAAFVSDMRVVTAHIDQTVRVWVLDEGSCCWHQQHAWKDRGAIKQLVCSTYSTWSCLLCGKTVLV